MTQALALVFVVPLALSLIVTRAMRGLARKCGALDSPDGLRAGMDLPIFEVRTDDAVGALEGLAHAPRVVEAALFEQFGEQVMPGAEPALKVTEPLVGCGCEKRTFISPVATSILPTFMYFCGSEPGRIRPVRTPKPVAVDCLASMVRRGSDSIAARVASHRRTPCPPLRRRWKSVSRRSSSTPQ